MRVRSKLVQREKEDPRTRNRSGGVEGKGSHGSLKQ